MLSLILGLIPGLLTTVNGITNAIANEKIAALNATTTQEQIAAQERVNTLQAQRDVLIADASRSSLDIYIRSIIAIGPACYTVKYYLWDKVLQSLTGGSTDPINTDMKDVLIAVVAFYFMHSIASMFRK